MPTTPRAPKYHACSAAGCTRLAQRVQVEGRWQWRCDQHRRSA